MVTDLLSWKALQKHYNSIKNVHLKDLFENEKDRQEKYTLEAEDLTLDYSKNRFTDETLELFWKLLDEVNLKQKIDAMFNERFGPDQETGERIIAKCVIVMGTGMRIDS